MRQTARTRSTAASRCDPRHGLRSSGSGDAALRGRVSWVTGLPSLYWLGHPNRRKRLAGGASLRGLR
ncbi:hypothetical protein ACFPRL_03760 [Pseudoclavibacter helvolus]